MIFSLENIIILSWYGWAKIPPPIFFLFIMLLYLFTFTDNIPCELKFCPTYIEAQTKLVCQQVVQKKTTTEPKHPNIIMSQWQNTTAMHGYAYIQVKAAYNDDSQVNNCSVCPQWTWTTAFNCSRQGIPVNFSISLGLLLDPWLSFWLHTYQFSYTLDILFRSDSPRPLGRPLPACREIEFVVSILRRSLTELNAHFLLENFTNTFCIQSLDEVL